jgi:hypothetical protein
MTMQLQRVLKTVSIAALLAAAACASSERQRVVSVGDVPTGAGTTASARKFLEGRWLLESAEIMPPGAKPIPLKATGVLNYDNFGNLEMNIRADKATSDLLSAAGIVIPDGVISTSGRTAIDMQNKTLTYILEGQTSAMKTGGGPLAANKPRHWEVNGDVLTLTTRDDSGAPTAVSRWKKSS